MDHPQVDAEVCTGCGICIDTCPSEAIVMENDKAKILPDDCTDCRACEDDCPEGAIS